MTNGSPGHPHHHDHRHAEFDDGELGEMLDLGAEVLHETQAEMLDWVESAAKALSVQQILDLGAGTGTGTLPLARRFPSARLTALDVSAEMLDQLAAKVADEPRIRTVLVEADADWPRLEPVDLAWAALSLHHVPDPDRTLAEVFNALRPGGLFAVAEMEAPPRFLPAGFADDLGSRLWAGVAHEQAERLPTMGSDWGPVLERTGFTLIDQRIFEFEVTEPLPAIRRYAELFLRRLQLSVADRISDDDQAALARLLDPTSPDWVGGRTDLVVRGRRFGWLARRP